MDGLLEAEEVMTEWWLLRILKKEAIACNHASNLRIRTSDSKANFVYFKYFLNL